MGLSKAQQMISEENDDYDVAVQAFHHAIQSKLKAFAHIYSPKFSTRVWVFRSLDRISWKKRPAYTGEVTMLVWQADWFDDKDLSRGTHRLPILAQQCLELWVVERTTLDVLWVPDHQPLTNAVPIANLAEDWAYLDSHVHGVLTHRALDKLGSDLNSIILGMGSAMSRALEPVSK